MSSLWIRLTAGLRRMLDKVLRRKRIAIPTASAEAAATPEPEPAPATVPFVPPPVFPPWITKSAKLRALERARLKHDKFVTPEGERPIPQPKIERPKRAKAELPPAAPAPAVEYDEPILIAEWKEGDGQGDVLYKWSEFYGEFSFRDSILDQLDRYWVYLHRMRKNSPATYFMCKEVGATLVPYLASLTNQSQKRYRTDRDVDEYRKGILLDPYFRTHWPGFGCFVIGANPVDEADELASEREPSIEERHVLWCVKFAALTKLAKSPWYVQPKSGGHIYELLLWWDRPHATKHRRNHGWPQQHYVWISDAGDRIMALRTRIKNDGSYRSAGNWKLNYDVSKEERDLGYTAQLIICRKFCDIARLFEWSAYSMVRVQVEKDGMAATFGVSPQRMAYFFQDRDIEVQADGSRQKIFHVVRPHVRADGSVVKMHFRGVRKFRWAGYRVSVTVPGLDHFMMPDFDLASEIVPKRERRRKGWMEADELAKAMRKWIESGIGKTRH